MEQMVSEDLKTISCLKHKEPWLHYASQPCQACALVQIMQEIILPQKLDLHAQWHACADAARAWAEEMRYAPQAITADVCKALEDAGMGLPGKPNTLWSMAQEAKETIIKLRQRTTEGQFVRTVMEKDTTTGFSFVVEKYSHGIQDYVIMDGETEFDRFCTLDKALAVFQACIKVRMDRMERERALPACPTCTRTDLPLGYSGYCSELCAKASSKDPYG